MRKDEVFKMLKGSQELFIAYIVSEQNNFYKKMIKFNEHWMHFVIFVSPAVSRGDT